MTETDKVDIFKYSFDKKAMLAVLATSHMDSVNVYLLNEKGEVINSKTLGKDEKYTFVTSVAKGGTCYVAYVSADYATGSYEIDTTRLYSEILTATVRLMLMTQQFCKCLFRTDINYPT
ncbi:hypothetical protein [Ruminococcus sp.]|uniref:hypothetical protein n=1 Tax=Ruminococcus sp. TaxID=41978 RepID=UPI00283DCD25|nr:hypothetical protein [Ruminococcus sp.]